jgi:hypothetical protein
MEEGVAGVQEFRSSGVQEFRSSGVQEFRSSGVQEFRRQFKRILGENIGVASQASVSEFFEENERSRILQLLNSCNS